MAERRRYTAAEIMRMRRAVEHLELWGLKLGDPVMYEAGGMNSRVYNGDELIKIVEAQLLTYISQGMGPEDLEYNEEAA